MAYFADDRQDLLNGINEFLDCSIVIPPSDVEGKDLLKTVADFQKQLLRKRKEREGKKYHPVSAVEQDIKGTASQEEEVEVPAGCLRLRNLHNLVVFLSSHEACDNTLPFQK